MSRKIVLLCIFIFIILIIMLIFVLGLLIGFGSSYYVYSYTNIIRIEESQDLERQNMTIITQVDEMQRDIGRILSKLDRVLDEIDKLE